MCCRAWQALTESESGGSRLQRLVCRCCPAMDDRAFRIMFTHCRWGGEGHQRVQDHIRTLLVCVCVSGGGGCIGGVQDKVLTLQV